MGTLQEKWIRDKQMSKIVAERLLRKPEIASDPQANTGWSQAIMQQQLGTMGAGSGVGGYTTSGSPAISQGAQSNLSGKQC